MKHSKTKEANRCDLITFNAAAMANLFLHKWCLSRLFNFAKTEPISNHKTTSAMHKEIPNHYQRIAEQYPEFLKAVENLGAATKGAGTLSEKKADLVQLAAAVAIRSEGAVHSHTRQLLQSGNDAAEIRHAIILLTSTIGFPAVMAGLSWANDVIREFE